jgi:hypothetical protein
LAAAASLIAKSKSSSSKSIDSSSKFAGDAKGALDDDDRGNTAEFAVFITAVLRLRRPKKAPIGFDADDDDDDADDDDDDDADADADADCSALDDDDADDADDDDTDFDDAAAAANMESAMAAADDSCDGRA